MSASSSLPLSTSLPLSSLLLSMGGWWAQVVVGEAMREKGAEAGAGIGATQWHGDTGRGGRRGADALLL
jgi:hypothetical protein